MVKARQGELGRPTSAADRLGCFEQQYGSASISQHDRRGESIRPRADNDGVVQRPRHERDRYESRASSFAPLQACVGCVAVATAELKPRGF